MILTGWNLLIAGLLFPTVSPHWNRPNVMV
jgi:hypothetical protein